VETLPLDGQDVEVNAQMLITQTLTRVVRRLVLASLHLSAWLLSLLGSLQFTLLHLHFN
jgi:hypothetical protein